jgi:hypothetical protein
VASKAFATPGSLAFTGDHLLYITLLGAMMLLLGTLLWLWGRKTAGSEA